MTTIATPGYTPTIPEAERLRNERDAAIFELACNPGNPYWQNVYNGAMNRLAEIVPPVGLTPEETDREHRADVSDVRYNGAN